MAGSSWTNQVQNQVVVAGTGSGVFVYNGFPKLGNPPIIALSNSTTDPFGNSIRPSDSSSDGSLIAIGTGGTWMQVAAGTAARLLSGTGDVAEFGSGSLATFVSGAGGTRVLETAMVSPVFAAGTQAELILQSPSQDATTFPSKAELLAASIVFAGGPVTATAGTAAKPTVITTDTWQTMSLLNSWSLGGGGYAQYKLEPDNRVSIRGANVIPGTATGGTSIWTPPAAYNPSVTQRVEMLIENSTGAVGVDTPRFDVLAGGLQVQNIPASTTRVGWNGSYALD